MQFQAKDLQYLNRESDLDRRLASLQLRQETDPNARHARCILQRQTCLLPSLTDQSPKLYEIIDFCHAVVPLGKFLVFKSNGTRKVPVREN
mgnify:FL=1